MSSERLRDLLPAIELAVFERRRDGSFIPVAPLPSWFARLPGDATFPFLGHILEEAMQFWAARVAGQREWGPCAEVDQSGRPFHYRVIAANVADLAYLMFRLDTGSDELQLVLQRVRQQMLAAEQTRGEVRRTADELRALAGTLTNATSEESRRELAGNLSEKCNDLIRRIDALAGTTAVP